MKEVSERLSSYIKWQLRYQRDGYSVQALIDRGVPYSSLPEWYQEEPVLLEWDHVYVIGFWRLSSERSIGFSMGPIPHSKIVEYGYSKGLRDGTLELFETVVRCMDESYIGWATEQQTKARKAGSQPQIPVSGKMKQTKPRA